MVNNGLFRSKVAQSTFSNMWFPACCFHGGRPVQPENKLASASAVSFADLDLDPNECGSQAKGSMRTGTQDIKAARQSRFIFAVVFYDVYIALNTAGENRTRVGNPVPVLTAQTDFPVDTQRDTSLFILVYARSSFVEQSTPATQAISDEARLVPTIGFTDYDLDQAELGGSIVWTPPSDVTLVSHYATYLTDDQGNRSQVGSDVAIGASTEFDLPADFAQESWTKVQVYLRSTLAEQTTPQSLAISDTVAEIADINFTDEDLDISEIGGVVSWLEPTVASEIQDYVLYLGQGGSGASRSSLGLVANSTASLTQVEVLLPQNTALPLAFDRLLLYARSTLAEQSTPASQGISDALVTMDVNFTDQDLDEGEIGGTLSWELIAGSAALVTQFIAYMADSEAGDNVRTVLGTATPTSRSLALAPELSAQNFAHLLVYARSSLFEQTTPAATALVDVNASTSFTDFDLDADQLGGDITWTVPSSLDEVVSYAVYLAGPVAENRSQLNGLLSPSTSLLAIPPDTDRQTYTTLAVYTRSVLVEQSTPDLAILDDSQSTVQDLSFQDEDFDAGELAGNVTWTAPVDDRYVSSYQVYFANFSDGRERSEIGAPLPTALTSREILQDTALESFQFALVYTASSLAEQTTPAATAISDTSSAVEGLQFTDLDLDFEELGGEVSWTLPLLPVSVDVLLYLALNRAGSGRFLVGQVPGDVVNFTLPADTPKGSFNYLVVYTRSVSSEQTTPSSLQIIDTDSTAENISFIDKDLEAGEIGGTVSWAEPMETSQVQDYLLYLGLNDTRQRSSLGLTVAAASPATVLQADVLEDTFLATFDQIWVYARSTFAEQTTPAFQVLSDASTVLTVNFTDEDLDEGELGGKISFDVVSGDTSQVVTFSAYGADSEDGRGYRFALGAVQLGTWSLDLSPEVSVQNFSHLLLYARSSLFEQTTPAIIELTDVNASVSGTSFTDLDLDAEELGGRVSWALPYNLAQVVYYNVYVTDALGTNRSQIDGPLLATADSIVMPPNTPRQQYTRLAVFTQSALVEQTTPDAVEVEDVSSSVEELAFVDEDLDADELGGNVSWAPANDSRYVTGYKVYLANSSQGQGRQEIGFLESATDTGLEVPDNTALEGFRALLVYTFSSLAEQTTPVAQSLSDVSVTIRNVSFVDFDLDRQELGGEIFWALPTSTVQTDVSVYLAMSPSGSGRSLVAHVPGSTDTMALAADTPKGAFHFVAVYARSPFAEQTTPSVLQITDTDSSVGNLTFVDKDLDLDELGGIVSWDESADTAQVQDYLVFLASNASGDDRSAIGSPLPSTGPVLTLEAQLPPNTGLMAFKHVAVYARSALAEQSTPVFEELSDAFLTLAVNFTDQDLDEGDIGGTLAFDLASGDISQLQHFVIHLADAKVPPFRRFHLGDAMPGATSLTVAPELPAENFTHFLVYGQSSLFEQTTPSVVELVDNNASVSGTAFTDLDLDGYQLGGSVSWSLPENLNEVAHYNVYLSDGLGINRSQINGALAFTATSVEIAADTGKRDYSRLVVYTASALVEQTTPDSTDLVDTESRIEDLTFLDEDLDLEEVGGNASWNPANDSRYVLGYQVYLANLSDGSRGRQAVGGFLPVELTSILVPVNLPLQSFQYLLVYTRSSLAEQTTPAAQGFNAVTSVQSGVHRTFGVKPQNHLLRAWHTPDILHESRVRSVQDTFAPVSQLQFVDKANCIFLNEPHSLRGLSILAMMAWFIVELSPLCTTLLADGRMWGFLQWQQSQDLDGSEVGGQVSWEPPEARRTKSGQLDSSRP
ncbi:PIF1 [Symbiodinium sp. CCMP2592]|nr:PIF1 [Symbiodinium sp. CCMP2592]